MSTQAERREKGKIKARERDRQRKRDKRSRLTDDELNKLRIKEKVRIQKRRKNMSQAKKDKEKEKDRSRKSNKFVMLKKRRIAKHIKEIKSIEKVLRMRSLRSLVSEEDKRKSRHKAKVEMALGRKNGLVRKYKQRAKRDPNDLKIWGDFLRPGNLENFISDTPKLKKLHKKLKVLKKQFIAMENKEWQEAHKFDGMPTWTPGRFFKQKEVGEVEESVNKNLINMRKHRKKIKEKIEDYDKLRQRSGQSSDSDSESESDGVSEHGDTDV